MAPSAQFRRDPRFPSELDVEVVLSDWGVVDHFVGKNLSRGGMFLAMESPVSVGSVLRMAFALPQGATLRISGRVAHVVTPERAVAEGGPAGVGVRFDDLDAEARAGVDAVLAHLVQAWQGDYEDSCEVVPSREDALLSAFRAELNALRERHPFAALGLTLDADADDVGRAYLAQLDRWNPDRFRTGDDAVRSVVADIVILLTHAHDMLTDDDRRARLAASLRALAPEHASFERDHPRDPAIRVERSPGEEPRQALRAPIDDLSYEELELVLTEDAVDAPPLGD